MARKQSLTLEQQASIQNMAQGGMTASKIATETGLHRSLIRRTLKKWKVPPQPTSSAAPPQPAEADWYGRIYRNFRPREETAIPEGVDLGVGVCLFCKKHSPDIIIGLGLCRSCVLQEMNSYGSRPIAFGSCVDCRVMEPVPIHQMIPAGDCIRGLCGLHKQSLFAYSSREIKERTPPRRGSDLLWYDSQGAKGRGCWRAD